MDVTLTGFNGEVVAHTTIDHPTMWIQRPVATVNPEVEFEEGAAIMRVPWVNERGPEPFVITAERYMHIGDGIYRRIS